MRFQADDLWKVRTGDMTRLTIPYDRKPAPFKPGGYYVLERVVDVVDRRPCGFCDGSGARDGEPCGRCAGHGERVYYTTRTERVDGNERVQVLELAKVRPQDISDDQALEEGWESADEWRDAFFTDHGEAEFVWTLTFELTTQVPQFLAIQHGQVDPQQYTSSPARAIDDAEAPTAAEHQEWADAADADIRRQREIRRLEQRKQSLEEKIEGLRRKAA